MPQNVTAPARVPGFGEAFTDHMVTAAWDDDSGWCDVRLQPRTDLPMDPAMVGLHYGQVIFEGLKAFRCTDGSVALFRPREHALRFQRSARRMSMPELPVDTFVAAGEGLVAADTHLLPDDPALSLYLRPVQYASEPCLALRPAREYRLLLIAFVTGGFFDGQLDPVTVWISREYARAIPGGTGGVKVAGNYAPTYLVQQRAAEEGCHQVVWLDPVTHGRVQEMGGMNLFFVRGRGSEVELVTPPVSDTVLPGVTRSSLLTLAGRMGWPACEAEISVDQWREEVEQGLITEVFACGTAAGVTPVGAVRDGEAHWTVGDGTLGPVTAALREALVDIQQGRAPDPDGWRHPVAATSSGSSRSRRTVMTTVEETYAGVREIWEEVLETGIDRDSDFFAEGGHSLAVNQTIARIEERWGVRIRVRELFDNPILEDFVKVVHRGRDGAT